MTEIVNQTQLHAPSLAHAHGLLYMQEKTPNKSQASKYSFKGEGLTVSE